MAIPFTAQQFFEVFSQYNEAIWPIQILLYVVALIALALTFTEQRRAHRAIGVILSGLWLWSGMVYHLVFFTHINAAAWLFGMLFIISAAAFIWFGAVKERLHFRPATNPRSILGLALILYALVIYPLIGFFFRVSLSGATNVRCALPADHLYAGHTAFNRSPGTVAGSHHPCDLDRHRLGSSDSVRCCTGYRHARCCGCNIALTYRSP